MGPERRIARVSAVSDFLEPASEKASAKPHAGTQLYARLFTGSISGTRRYATVPSGRLAVLLMSGSPRRSFAAGRPDWASLARRSRMQRLGPGPPLRDTTQMVLLFREPQHEETCAKVYFNSLILCSETAHSQRALESLANA